MSWTTVFLTASFRTSSSAFYSVDRQFGNCSRWSRNGSVHWMLGSESTLCFWTFRKLSTVLIVQFCKKKWSLWDLMTFLYGGWRATCMHTDASFVQMLSAPFLLAGPSRSSGVPQGSVLGPLLFVLYVSDLPSFVLSSSCAMFADDSLLYNTTCSASAPNSSKHPPACCPLQEDASRVQSWADQWNTLFNAAKSSHMIISRSPVHSSPSITLHDIPVPYVTCTRHLGLLISSTLKWSAHVESLLSRVCWKVALLKRLLFHCYLSLHTFSFLYTALIRPCLEYATVVGDDCSSHDSHSLERTQLSLARSALSLRIPDPTLLRAHSSRCLSLGLLAGRPSPGGDGAAWQATPLLAACPRTWSSLSPREALLCIFPGKYSLRKPKSMEVPLCSTSAHLSPFLPSCSILWNTLPASVTSCSSLSSFASSLDSFFVNDKFSYGLPP